MKKTHDKSLVIGRNDKDDCLCLDLNNIEHAFIAGKSGSGKSCFLHSVIEKLIDWYSKEELKFSLFDGKMCEFFCYKEKNNITANSLINDLASAIKELDFIIEEMNSRLEQIENGNEKDFYKIVIIIDELGEFCFNDNFMERLRIVIQSGHLVGIHIIAAIQNVGLINADFINLFPSRICFSVCDDSESIKVLGKTGAEKLKLPGECFYKENGAEEIIYINNNKN